MLLIFVIENGEKDMLGLVGISFKSADISIREQFAFSKEDIKKFSDILQNNSNHNGLVVISTCNRTEIYFHNRKKYESEAFDLILSALTTLKNYNSNQRSNFYFKSGKDVAEHLFKVTAGIDSLVIGEDQIIGQVKNAFNTASEFNIADTIMSRLFSKALEAGKKVRSSTKINQGSASVSSAAVDLCIKNFPKLAKHSVLIIGAGQTGQLVLTSLGKRPMKSLYVANRTVEKAEELATRYNGKSLGLNEIEAYLPISDIIVVATDSQNYLLSKKMIEKSVKLRQSFDKQLFIDLSVPRNIDPGIAGIKSIDLYAVDDLTEIVNSTTQKRTEAIEDAMKIIEELSEEFMDWLVIRGLSPIFEKIKESFSQVHKSEFEGFVKVNGITDYSKVEEYGKHISDKYARLLIRNLRSMVKNGESRDSIEAIYELFEM